MGAASDFESVVLELLSSHSSVVLEAQSMELQEVVSVGTVRLLLVVLWLGTPGVKRSFEVVAAVVLVEDMVSMKVAACSHRSECYSVVVNMAGQVVAGTAVEMVVFLADMGSLDGGQGVRAHLKCPCNILVLPYLPR